MYIESIRQQITMTSRLQAGCRAGGSGVVGQFAGWGVEQAVNGWGHGWWHGAWWGTGGGHWGTGRGQNNAGLRTEGRFQAAIQREGFRSKSSRRGGLLLSARLLL